jgi:predicted O-methyltransferase YrrM
MGFMLRFVVRVLNRLLAPADVELTRASRLREIETRLADETRHNGELRELLTRATTPPAPLPSPAPPPPAPPPAPFDDARLVQQIGGLIDSKLNDAYLMGYHEASRTTAAYINARMAGAKVFRTPHLTTRGDHQARYDLLAHSAAQVRGPGLYLEFGVYCGDTINRLARQVPGTKVYGFDSFEGLPEDWFHEQVKGAFDLGGKLPVVEANVELFAGWFQDTLPGFLDKHPGPVTFCHIDCDLYSSSAFVLTALKDRFVPGSVIVFDEYFNYPGWETGEFQAFAEFVRANGIRYRYLGFTPQWYSAAVVIDAIGDGT